MENGEAHGAYQPMESTFMLYVPDVMRPIAGP